ncbi:hypothetical protein QBC40DRAFT_288817 [Triangularia verruculosa]|uniref:DUF7708 domain-containing protein n=1 Tax=Triangularia verruculosa TaxID=2587418 RepID=A0AAN6X7L5_9PEZI|nr:hypothetical protein QBC40DRAFT_288817 [Triangularia verruculosa]
MGSSFRGAADITPIVRSYSLKAEEQNPDDILSQALSSTAHQELEEGKEVQLRVLEWSHWLRAPSQVWDDPVFNPLEQQRKELVRVWQEFQRLFVNSGAHSITEPDSHHVPTIEALQAAVNDAQATWELKRNSGFGRAKTRFLGFMETMNDHSYLFKLLPTEDKYISLFAGVVATVVKASVNYQKIAEGFSLALLEMSADLRFVENKTQIANTKEMQQLVVQLYVKVFEFLCHAMSFFHKRRKRFFASFDKSFYDKTVEHMVHDIQKVIRRIQNEAQHASELRMKDMHSKVDQLFKLQQLAIDSHGNSQQEVHDKNAAAAAGFQRLGETAVRHLGLVEERVRLAIITQNQENATSHKTTATDRHPRDGPRERTAPHMTLLTDDEGGEASSTESSAATASDRDILTRYEMQQYTQHLNQYTEDGAEDVIRRAVSNGTAPVIPQEVFTELSKWIGGTRPPMMWIEAPADSPSGPVLSQAAIEAVNTITNAGTPCISVFCKSRYGFASRMKLGHRDAAVVSLYYSVIRQLTRIVPPEFDGRPELRKQNLERLDGTLKSLSIASRVIVALLKHAPPSIAWIIDGIEFAGGSTESNEYLREFIHILRGQEEERTSKACFTTDGRSMVLDRTIRVRERVDASRLTLARPGAVLAGGVNINQIGGSMGRGRWY